MAGNMGSSSSSPTAIKCRNIWDSAALTLNLGIIFELRNSCSDAASTGQVFHIRWVEEKKKTQNTQTSLTEGNEVKAAGMFAA